MCGENGEECKNAISWNIMLLVLCCPLALKFRLQMNHIVYKWSYTQEQII
jgi:hypothetical protein